MANTHLFTLDLYLGLKITQNNSKYPLNHMINVPVKIEAAELNSLDGDTFKRKKKHITDL